MDKNLLLGFIEFSENDVTDSQFDFSQCPICRRMPCVCGPFHLAYAVWPPPLQTE